MTKLLHANFHRLWKNKVFWLSISAMLALSAYAVIGTAKNNKGVLYSSYAVTSPEILLCAGGSLVGILTAVCIAFYIGTEYGDGTMRNKLIVGHTRRTVYLSNLIVCITASVIMDAAYILGIAVGGIAVIGAFKLEMAILLKCVIVSVIGIMAVSAFLMMIAMSIQSKAITVAVLILTAFLTVSYEGIVHDRLTTPEYYEAYTWFDDKGNAHEEPRQKNPSYPTGVKRKYYETVNTILPGCQRTQINTLLNEKTENGKALTKKENKKLLVFTGYLLLILIASSGGGMLLYKRKDIK